MSDETSGYGASLAREIAKSGLGIYDSLDRHPELWISTEDLEILLNSELSGLDFAGLPLRTRSKRVKEAVCKVLGYPVPKTFRKTQPRFPGQCFDVYVQKSNNLQIWNEELSASRRYVLIRLSSDDVVTRVKVVSGDALAKLDTTGTLTQKYQARCTPTCRTELVSSADTNRIAAITTDGVNLGLSSSPSSDPQPGRLLSIESIFQKLSPLVGASFNDPGSVQERLRGEVLHRLVSDSLGYTQHSDSGQFPDIRHQLLEVKLQTSPTIDLGLVLPTDEDELDMMPLNGVKVRHCDVRYAVFCGEIEDKKVLLTHFILTTGEDFGGRFPQFQGKVLNKKLQIPLPAGFL